jgi:hypothetical protein
MHEKRPLHSDSFRLDSPRAIDVPATDSSETPAEAEVDDDLSAPAFDTEGLAMYLNITV